MQAPKARKDERDRRGPLLILAAALVLAAVAGAAFFLLGGGESKTESVPQAMRDAGCTYRTFKGAGTGVHISNPAATPKEWNSFPPTSGPHFGQWVLWGEYDQPVQLARAIHNLEHGGIAMYYGSDVPDDEIAKLRSFYRSDPTAMLLAPLPRLGDKLALTAWYAPDKDGQVQVEASQGILAECTGVDENAFKTFRDAYRFKGPERVPPESLQPGT
ncbi:MAG TPA: DUF3105 domain-containing protein [Gaiellaceae bacterium]|nr:DUF3105 domain-containing protein [Gaiellaceae bacterium]